MLSRSLVLAILLTGLAALAQDSGPDFDADIPDGSVGIGGAEQSQEMGDGMTNTVCAVTRDCERGFTCNRGHCVYSGFRVASCEGCGGGTVAMVFPMVVLWRRTRRRER